MTPFRDNAVTCLLPGNGQVVSTLNLSVSIVNTNGKPVYVRIGPKSIRVSDRRPAAYGARR